MWESKNKYNSSYVEKMFFFKDFISCGHFQMPLRHLLSLNSTLATEQ